MKLSSHPLHYSIHSRLRAFHLKRLLPSNRKGLLLDVGCGLGYLSEALGQNYTAVGLDYDFRSLRRRPRNGIKFPVQGSASALPFENGVFDLVICSELLEHLPDGVDALALGEIVRVLKPGGRLLITVPCLEGIRASSELRNLGHTDPHGGEYHFRTGYHTHELKMILDRLPLVRIRDQRFSMFLLSELFMDAMKWAYLKKNRLQEQADIMSVKKSFFFHAFRLVFPFIYALFLLEDIILCPLCRGHILIVALEKLPDRLMST